MKTFAMVCGLSLAAFSTASAADTRAVLVFGPNGRIYVIRPSSSPARSHPARPIAKSKQTPVTARRTPLPTRTSRAYPPFPRPDVHLRPFSIYSDSQMRRLESWIMNNPYWTPERKRSQIRWWKEQNEWMKRQNDSHIRRTFGPWGGGR